jgi:L-lactate dehydrogenase complex protein LldG
MNAREEILQRLRTQSPPAGALPNWKSRRQFDDLATQFTQALTAVYGEVITVANQEEAITTLDSLWESWAPQQIVVNDVPQWVDFNWRKQWPEINWQVTSQDGQSATLRNFAARADVGISGCVAALAETGTVVLASGPGRSRLATLLPPVHIALVYRAQIQLDIFTWTAGRDEDWPANVVLVSGPSKTADIEQTLTVGVHGPKRFIVLMIDA